MPIVPVLLMLAGTVTLSAVLCPYDSWSLGICEQIRRSGQEQVMRSWAGARKTTWPSSCPRVPWHTLSPRKVRELLVAGVPTVLTNASAAFGDELAELRSLSTFLRRFGDVAVKTALFDAQRKGVRLGTQPMRNGTAVGYPYKRTMRISDAFARMSDDADSADAWVEQSSLFPHSRIFSAIDWARVRRYLFDAAEEMHIANLWFGRAKHGRVKESALHTDTAIDNLLLQLQGSKKFVMFDPVRSSPLLYPWTMRSYMCADPFHAKDELQRWEERTLDNFSPVDIGAPDVSRFPRFTAAVPLVCRVRAGEALLMPRWTWHNVFSYHDLHQGAGQTDGVHPDEDGGDGGSRVAGRVARAANLALNLWFVAGGKQLDDFDAMQRMAMDRLVRHNDEHHAPDVPEANFLQEDEERDELYHGGWDNLERRESDSLQEDGEREFDMLGCDTADVDAPCAKRRIRDLLGSYDIDMNEVTERRVEEDDERDERDDGADDA